MEHKDLKLELVGVEERGANDCKLTFVCYVNLDAVSCNVLVGELTAQTILVSVGGLRGEVGVLERDRAAVDLAQKTEEVTRLKQRIVQLEQNERHLQICLNRAG